ncbi:unnamed protein product (macronuclear) [Paramecium tetraurelia]|uniref:Death domain-containing protein n=1 Tax=Paramecium tetraurelia TaxID=5888 RepID=A0E3M5_PARTE|nr:uncharacterized protein GSPATT00023065001 [Paramecium tetraurelia]CAK89892.1 unnamed protein product [Paramecium tetraurelia]|eukprot:XP_001457289.1 hypothetical protein (macronuclear) [Paramecium tetraurelia strain d4-2]
MLLTLKYLNKIKQINLDKRVNVQSLQILLAQLFTIKNRIIGLIDQDGNFYDLSQFIQLLQQTRCNMYTIVSEENYNQKDNKLLQTSLKYSQMSDYNNRLSFIDFIYDLEEFQQILGGDQYTCIYLIDEKDYQGLDFLCALEPLINNFNNWINFFYSFSNRLQDQARENDLNVKLLWIYKGSKKIVSFQLNNDKKMRQMDEIIQKLVQAKLQGTSTRTSNIKQQSQISSQQSPNNRRSKSIRKLVEESQTSNNNLYMNSNFGPSKLITRVQAKLIQRDPSRGSENFEDYRSQQQHSSQYQQQSNIYQNESIISQQDMLFALVGDLEVKEILDVTMARLVKRLLIEENKEIIQVLQIYLQNHINIQQLCERLNKIIENCTYQERPTSPFQTLKQTKPQMNSQDSNRSAQQDSLQSHQTQLLEDIKNKVIERNNYNYTSEQFGIMNVLWNQQDQVLLQLCTDIYNKMQKGEQPSLKPLQIYSGSKFNQLLQQNFKLSEITMIHEYNNSHQGSIYAVLQYFRYQTNIEQFINDLRKAINSVQSQNQHLNQPQKQQTQESKVILLFKQIPKAPSPQSVLMPNFQLQENTLTQATATTIQQQQQQEQQQEHQQEQQQQLKKQKENQIMVVHQTQPIPQQIDKKIEEVSVIQTSVQEQPIFKKSDIMSRSEQISPQKRISTQEVAANVIFLNEENFMQTKKEKRLVNMGKIDQFYSIQVEKELEQIFKDMLWDMDLEEPKVRQVEMLFSEHNQNLYEILQGWQSSRNINGTRTKLIKLLSEQQVKKDDYRKIKMYNLFMNQVRQFTLQNHLQDNAKNFLLKMFMDNDLQVLGTFETYLQNQDAEDMLENLKLIIKQYSKFTNINSPNTDVDQQPIIEPIKNQLSAKEILLQIRKYFSAEEKNRLENTPNEERDLKIVQLYQDYLQDQDLNGFISAVRKLSQQDQIKKQFEDLLQKLQKEGQLKIDDYMLSVVNQRRNEQTIKGVFELYLFNKNIEDFVESIKSISKILQQELILQTLNQFEKEKLLDERKIAILKEKAYDYHKDYPKLLGAFALYFEQASIDQEEAKKEILETLSLFSS